MLKRSFDPREFDSDIPDSISEIESCVKRQKVEEVREEVSMEELNNTKGEHCLGCRFLTPALFKDRNNNKKLIKLFQLYTTNRLYLTDDALASSMHEFYQRVIYPDTGIEWSVEDIKYHNIYHTRSPTAEVLTQIDHLKSIRNALSRKLFEQNEDGKRFPNLNNIKLFMQLQKEIRTLLSSGEALPNMIGFNQQLNF